MNREFNIEFYEENGKQKMTISTEDDFGTTFDIDSFDDVGEIISEYIGEYAHDLN